ncbi:MAG: hypothetical protein F6J87_15870, partial [Spirulina sp. SIO3F2]|nr:hypothetical protein [Spirulina sp. SIO3F2]
VTRTLTINREQQIEEGFAPEVSESDTAATPLDIVPLDLERVDGATTIPAGAIAATVTESTATDRTLQQVQLTLDLTQIQQSGEFKGMVLIRDGAQEQTVPLTIELKDAPTWPIAALSLGVLLGFGLSIYRAEGQERDRLVVQIGRIRTRMRADNALTFSFQTRLSAHLTMADTQLDDRWWAEARASISSALAIWQKWLQYREDWLTQTEYIQALPEVARQRGVPDTMPYGQFIFRALDDLEKQVADYATPQQVRDKLVVLQEQVGHYHLALNALSQLEFRGLLPSDQQYWQHQRAHLDAQLNELDPSNPQALAQWQDQLQNAQQEFAAAVQQATATSPNAELETAQGRSLQLPTPSFSMAIPAVSEAALSSSQRVARARWRLIAVNWASRTIAIGLFAFAGFTQLYSPRATFGADPLADYFALMAWGLGAETTRSSIVKVIQDLGVSLPKQ